MTEIVEQSGANLYERPEEASSDKAFVRRWLEAIKLSEDEEKDWRKQALEAQRVYCSDEAQQVGTAFNLYHANIETMVPALYNSTPVPDIRNRYGVKDQQSKDGADAIERALSYLIDEYDFDEVVERTVHHFALAGRGVARVDYEGQLVDSGGVQDVGAQFITCRVVPWASFRRGPGHAWDQVPWVAYEHHMTRQQLEALDPVIGKQVKLDLSDNTEDQDADKSKPESDIFKKAQVWEIWDKAEREVIFLSESYPEKAIKRIPDPLGLKGFFNIPRPLQINRGDDTMVPLCTYNVQRPLLDELDQISRRIRRLVKQLRPRALGPGNVDVDALAKADDGEIVGITDVMQFLDAGGMEKLLAWFPLDPTVKAIQSLYDHRERVKMDLFEVSGLADVMRGQSNPNETLGAQQMKTQWGSLRVQRHQQEVQRFARDILRIKAEIVAEKFTPENIAAMTGLQLAAPQIALIRDQKMRDYRIDIETDSTIRADLTRNMTQMAQFMQGTGQFLSAAPGAMQAGIPVQVLMTVFSAFARNFKLGKEVDDMLNNLPQMLEQQQAQQQQQPNPEQIKAELEREKMGLEREKMQQEIPLKQADIQLKGMDMELKKMDLAAKQQQMAHADVSLQLQQQDHGMKRQQMEADHGLRREEMGMKREQMVADQGFKAKDLELKAKGKDGSSKVQVGGKSGLDAEELAPMFENMARLIAEGQQNTAQLIAAGNQQLVAAITAPKTVTTPDGRTYVSQTASVN